MTTIPFTLTRYDPDQLWIVVSTDHMTVELDASQPFLVWAPRAVPGPERAGRGGAWPTARVGGRAAIGRV